MLHIGEKDPLDVYYSSLSINYRLPSVTREVTKCYSPCRRGAVELRAHSYAPRLDTHWWRRPGELAIAHRPTQPRPRLSSTCTPAVYEAGVLLAPPPSAYRTLLHRQTRAVSSLYSYKLLVKVITAHITRHTCDKTCSYSNMDTPRIQHQGYNKDTTRNTIRKRNRMGHGDLDRQQADPPHKTRDAPL